LPTPSDQPAPRIAALEQENADLRRQLAHFELLSREQQETIGQLQSHLATMSEQIVLLKKALFGRRRERYVPSPDQKLLFSSEPLEGGDEQQDEEDDPSGDADEDGSETRLKRRRRRKRKRFEFPQCLPVTRIEHPLLPEERACPCGCGDRAVISEHVTRQLELVPANAYVTEHVRYTYACPKCRRGDQVVTTEKPDTAIEKGVFGPTVLAYLAEGKFARHLPLYRLQEQLQTSSRMWFHRSVLSGSLCRAAKRLMPLRDLIHAEILQSFYLHADETTARLLRARAGKALLTYLWAYAGDAGHPYVLFDFHRSRSRDGPRAIMGDYRGGLVTDGHSAYESLVKESEGRLLDLGCWAHGRRGFDQACAVSSHVVAHEALAWIQQLYDLEDQLADSSPEERHCVRGREAVPTLTRLEERLREVAPTLRPSSKLAEAIQYVLNRWPAMTRYTEDGRYPIDNNLIERLLRPAVVGRKNYLFFGSDVGGDAAAIWYTFIQSARRNLVDILPYLTDVLTRLPSIVPEYLPQDSESSPFRSLSAEQVSALRSLLPDQWLREHPEHLLADRADELANAIARRRRRRAQRRLAVKS
jgi:transposase